MTTQETADLIISLSYQRVATLYPRGSSRAGNAIIPETDSIDQSDES